MVPKVSAAPAFDSIRLLGGGVRNNLEVADVSSDSNLID